MKRRRLLQMLGLGTAAAVAAPVVVGKAVEPIGLDSNGEPFSADDLSRSTVRPIRSRERVLTEAQTERFYKMKAGAPLEAGQCLAIDSDGNVVPANSPEDPIGVALNDTEAWSFVDVKWGG